MAHAFNMGVDMMDKTTREAENALDRLLAHMGDVRHYLPVHSKPWVVKEMAMILSEVRSETALGRPITIPQPTVPAEPQTPATAHPKRPVAYIEDDNPLAEPDYGEGWQDSPGENWHGWRQS